MLEAAGHRVDVVADGADAVMAVQTAAYDVVLMDVQMPGHGRADGRDAPYPRPRFRRARRADHRA